jgi:hypothetical protein
MFVSARFAITVKDMVSAFDVLTPLGFRVHCTQEWWEYISTIKHPVLKDRLEDIVATLVSPSEVRQSTKDPSVLLYYRPVAPRLLCAVIRAEGDNGFLITAYPADSIKRGEIVWSVSE